VDGASLDTQRQQIAGYAVMKGWAIDEHFVEEGVSGSTPLDDRPEGKRLLSTLRKGDVVVTAKLDRAFRSSLDALNVPKGLKDRGVSLHMIDLGGDVTGNGWCSPSWPRWPRARGTGSASASATASGT
jgi:putative DNA-invertase from lambdoid prophage Rac